MTHERPIFVGWEQYKVLTDSFEVLALACPKGHNLVKITKEPGRIVFHGLKKVGEVFCPECMKYHGPA